MPDPKAESTPRPMEVESARLLENEDREELRAMGLEDEQIRKLADTYIAETEGEPGGFADWARSRIDRGEVPSG